MSVNQNLNPNQIKTIIKNTADNIDYKNLVYKNKIGSGRVNAYWAVSEASGKDGTPVKVDININSVFSNTITASWSGIDNESSIVSYSYNIGKKTTASPYLLLNNWVDLGKNNTLSYTSSLLSSGSTYYVLIKALNSVGHESIFISNETVFSPMTLNFLQDGLGYNDIDINFSIDTISAKWSIKGAVKYYYEISQNPNLTPVFSKSTTDNYITENFPLGLTQKSTYYVYIQGEDQNLQKSAVYRTNGVYIGSLKIDEIINCTISNTLMSDSKFNIMIPPKTFNADSKVILEPILNTTSDILTANNNIKDLVYKNFAINNGSFYNFKVLLGSTLEEIKKFNNGIVIKLPYLDLNNDKILDGSDVFIHDLGVFYLDYPTMEWKILNNYSYDYLSHQISFITDNSSIYAVLKTENKTAVSDIVIYPNPLKVLIDTNFKVSNLPNDVENLSIYIYDIRGKLLKKLDEKNLHIDINGKVLIWDAISDDGLRLSSGVYLFVIKYNGKTKIEKVAILR